MMWWAGQPIPAQYAGLLDLVVGAEYDPRDVLEKVLELDPKAAVSVQDLIRAFGLRKKGRARNN